LTMTSLPPKITSERPVENSHNYKNNLYPLVTLLISLNASKLKQLLIKSSKQTWINMIRITLCQISEQIMTLSQHRTTLRKLVVNWLNRVLLKETLSQRATQQDVKPRLPYLKSKEKDFNGELMIREDQT